MEFPLRRRDSHRVVSGETPWVVQNPYPAQQTRFVEPFFSGSFPRGRTLETTRESLFSPKVRKDGVSCLNSGNRSHLESPPGSFRKEDYSQPLLVFNDRPFRDSREEFPGNGINITHTVFVGSPLVSISWKRSPLQVRLRPTSLRPLPADRDTFRLWSVG